MPGCKKDVRAFLGFVNFYRYYIPRFSELSVPLTNLLKKSSTEVLAWNKDCQESLDNLKLAMTQAPVLISPNFDKIFYLEVDSYMYAAGACLFQMENNSARPILFISKKFSEGESRLSSLERECLGVLIIVTRLKYYLLGRKFILLVDAKPLVYLREGCSKSDKLLRWSLRLSEYEYEVSHVKGLNMLTSDFLSRFVEYGSAVEEGDAVHAL